MDLHTIRQAIVDRPTRDYWNVITCWGSGAGPIYRYGLSSERSDEHGIQTEVQAPAMLAVLIADVDISITWGYDPDESLWGFGRQDFDFSDFLPSMPDEKVKRMYVDVFYRGQLVDRELFVVADGGRHYVPIPRTTYPNKTGHGPAERGAPEHHYTRWQLGLARTVNSFELGDTLDEVLERMNFVVDD